MSNRHFQFLPCFTLVNALLVVTTAVAQPTRFHDVTFLITHGDLDALSSDYFLFVRQSGHSDAAGPIDNQRLIAPDGTVFSNTRRSIRRNSFAEIASTLIGN